MAETEVKYVKECASGHTLKPGDKVITLDGQILCQKCDVSYYTKSTELTYSNKFCMSCFIELPLDKVTECPACEAPIDYT